MLKNLKHRTANAFAWSLFQSWSVKALSLLLFLFLARVLPPDQMGLAQSVTVLLAFIAVVAEQGFHSAIVQKQDIRDVDVNLPFFISLFVALLASAAMLFFAAPLADLSKTPNAADLIRTAAVIPPITAVNGILVAMFRRELDFKSIARASFGSSLISGLVALFLVLQGWGAMALVIQAAISGLVTSALIWTRPVWTPTWRIETVHFKSLLGFSTVTFISQLIDFFSGRLIDMIILSRFGLDALGIYAVGSKLYLTILDLLASALTVVAMSAMAKLAADGDSLKRTYLRLLFLASSSTLPFFVACAALAPELCTLLFGNKWHDAASVAQWLCLLGAMQVVQLFNHSALDATGNPRGVLVINVSKLTIGMVVLLAYPVDSVAQLTLAFVVAQLMVSPLSFGLAMQVTRSHLHEVLQQIFPGLLAASLAFFAVTQARSVAGIKGLAVWQGTGALGVIFVSVFLVVLWLQSSRKLRSEWQYVRDSYKN
jgi:O-antigen/teichoic acid export membrane protein